MTSIYTKFKEYLGHVSYGGSASPNSPVFYETTDIPLIDVMKLYEKDATCKSSVDLLAASAVKRFYTTCAPESDYAEASKAKAAVDDFCEEIDLDTLLHDMAIRLIACGNDFWLKLTPDTLSEFVRTPIDAFEKIQLTTVQGFKIPYKVSSYQLKHVYREGGDGLVKPEAVVHWYVNRNFNSGYGVGLLQVLLHTLAVDRDKRPAYAWMKAKIERVMPKVFEKYAGPDVLVGLPKASEDTLTKFQNVIKNRPEEGAWLFFTGADKNGGSNVSINPVQLDPRGRFEYYIDHIVNQFYLGCETPLPRLFSTPGFTEASANAALELQDMLVDPISRMIKRRVEREIFSPVVSQAGLDPVKAGVRLNWGSPDAPEVTIADLISAAGQGLIRRDEFRKNAVKFGWQLWEPEESSKGG